MITRGPTCMTHYLDSVQLDTPHFLLNSELRFPSHRLRSTLFTQSCFSAKSNKGTFYLHKFYPKSSRLLQASHYVYSFAILQNLSTYPQEDCKTSKYPKQLRTIAFNSLLSQFLKNL